LAASEARLRAIFEAAPDAIISIDEEGIIRLVNPAAERLFGYAAQELIGKNVSLLMPSPYRDEHDRYLARYLATGEKKIIDIGRAVVGLRKDGSVFPLDLSVAEARLGDWRVFVGIIHDITERNRTEERFRLVVESMPNAIVVVNTEGNIVLVNSQAEVFFGYHRKELVGQPVEILVPERFRAKHSGYRERFLASPLARPMGEGRDLYGRRKDGGEFPVEIGLTPIHTGEGVLVLSAIVDITERKRTQDQISHLVALVESSDDAIISLALDGTIVNWNAGAEQIYGYSAAEVNGRSISILAPPDRRDEQEAIFAKARRGESTTHFTTVQVRKDTRRIDVALTISPIKNAAGKIVGISVIARDITDQKRADEALRQSKEELEKTVAALRAKSEEIHVMTQQLWQAAKLASVGELAASIAHELNNPLATITLRIESLMGHMPDSDPRRRALEVVEQETKRMGDLVANLLQFSRRGPEQISTVDVRQELIKAVELIHHQLRKQLVTVAQEFAADTPTIYGDRQKLRQVFLNLLTNASDAMPQGGNLTLRTATATLDNGKPAVLVEFIDSGAGIPAEYQEKIMEPFFTTKEEGKGTGLGLAICRRIVREHHGTIQIDSEAGKGTTVRLLLAVKNGANVDRLRGGPALE
jgi:PAS domain S-box-containing protein